MINRPAKWAKYLVPGQSLVYLQQATEEANERARIAMEEMIVKNLYKRYEGWEELDEKVVEQ